MTATVSYSIDTIRSEFQANSVATVSYQINPDVLAFSNGGYVVAYSSSDHDRLSLGFYGPTGGSTGYTLGLVTGAHR